MPESTESDTITPQRPRGGGAPTELGGRLAGLSIPRQVFVLAIWPLLEQLLGFAVAATDQVLAGRFDAAVRMDTLDALAVGGYFSWLLMILQGAVGTGGLALISRSTGAGDHGLARRALGQALVLGTAVGFVVMLVSLPLLPLLVRAFGLEGEAADLGVAYLRIVCLSAPFTGFLLAATAGLRGSGDTRTPFFIMTVVNLVNIGFSWLFTFGPEPFGGHGVQGLAAGTVVSWVVGAVLAGVVLAWSRADFRLERTHLKPHAETLRRIIRVGLPSAVEVSGMWLINAWLLRLIASLPQEGSLGTHMIAIRIESLSFLPGFALGAASATLAGQYLGLGDRSRAGRAALVAWIYGGVLMTVLGVLFLVFPAQLIGLVVPDSPVHVELGVPLLILAGVSQPFLATVLILKHTFRGTGDTRAVMRISYTSMILFRVGAATLVYHTMEDGLFWIWVCMTLDLVVQAIVFSRRFFKGDWQLAKV